MTAVDGSLPCQSAGEEPDWFGFRLFETGQVYGTTKWVNEEDDYSFHHRRTYCIKILQANANNVTFRYLLHIKATRGDLKGEYGDSVIDECMIADGPCGEWEFDDQVRNAPLHLCGEVFLFADKGEKEILVFRA